MIEFLPTNFVLFSCIPLELNSIIRKGFKMFASGSMEFVTKKVSRMSTRLKSRRSTLTGSISYISKSCMLKRPTFKPWMPGPERLLDFVRTSMYQRPTFKRKKPVQRVPSIRDAFDEMCRTHIMDFVLVSFDVISSAPYLGRIQRF